MTALYPPAKCVVRTDDGRRLPGTIVYTADRAALHRVRLDTGEVLHDVPTARLGVVR